MKIAIVGAGYVGLTCGAVFAKLGHTVTIVEKDGKKLEMLAKGNIPFYEPSLHAIVKNNLANNMLRFTKSYEQAISQANVIFICVGTPPKKNGASDLTQIYEAAASIGKFLKDLQVIIIKSTVPVGTNEKAKELMAARTRANFFMASCPEFLREGSAVSDTLRPHRLVLGVSSAAAKKILIELHRKIPGPRVITDIRTAELIKYASNAFLATKISFINEIANVCDEVGADVSDVALGMGLDPRIGPGFLKAGIGYGGSCFPKDTRALNAVALSHNYDFKLLKAVIEVNQKQREIFKKKVLSALGSLRGKCIGVLGLAFKNNTDDVRESAAIEIVRALLQKGASIKAYDPKASQNAKKILPKLKIAKTPEEVSDASHAILILTEWLEFTNLNWARIKQKMRSAIIIDGRNLLNPKEMQLLGFTYISVGRPNA